ncbi:hypothetical protein IWQ62_005030 [Dispira parvispora]|uniref:Uncharacterized protein n=1 Tax=Dispira parvispora TaxID=1520584 RepID=A0A9W8E021_9FUNG|nr:hypothetical protein IWQ62_005030 [Dispira parvispora]
MRFPLWTMLMVLYLLTVFTTVRSSPLPYHPSAETTDWGEIQHLQRRFIGGIIAGITRGIGSIVKVAKNAKSKVKANAEKKKGEKAKKKEQEDAKKKEQEEAKKKDETTASTGGSSATGNLGNAATVAPAAGMSKGDKAKYVAGGAAVGVGGTMLMNGSGEESGQKMEEASDAGADSPADGATETDAAPNGSAIPDSQTTSAVPVQTSPDANTAGTSGVIV